MSRAPGAWAGRGRGLRRDGRGPAGGGRAGLRGRRWRRIGLVVAVLAVLVTIADRSAAVLVQQRIADRVRAAVPGAGDPRVTLHGIPAVSQLVAGRFAEVDVEARDLRLTDLPVRTLELTLRDVTLTGGAAEVSAMDATVLLAPDGLQAIAGDRATVSTRDGQLVLGRTLLGLPVRLAYTVSVENGTLSLRAAAATLAGRPVDPSLLPVDLAVIPKTPDLPLGLRLDSARATDDGLELHGSGRNLHLGGPA
jgi:LmeA-like phospholipid-binding